MSPFVYLLHHSPSLVAAQMQRTGMLAALDALRRPSATRDALARQFWIETVAITCHDAHDVGIAAIEAALPHARASRDAWRAFFVAVAQMAGSTDGATVPEDLGRAGLLPIVRTPVAPTLRGHGGDLCWRLDIGDACGCRQAMTALAAGCTFPADMRGARDGARRPDD